MPSSNISNEPTPHVQMVRTQSQEPNSHKPESSKFRFSLSNINPLWLILTILVFSALLKLGSWQNDRALEKELRLERISELKQQKAISLSQVLLLAKSHQPDYINDFPVIINGSFDPKFVFLHDNQVNGGSLGYRVLQVVQVGEHAVLVNLGWVQGSINRQELPDITPFAGKIEFRGNIRFVETGIMLMEQKFDNKQWPLRIQQIELKKFSQLIDLKLLPFVVYLDKNESLGYEKNWQPIVMPPEKHRAYAFQWFSLAIAWITLMIWATIRLGKNNHENTNSSDSN
ncbi:MAG: SURF1 family protein [Alteromonadaceae bacterium]|nr:SURF1 family protein [Alteromonadaceae bacterium]